MLSRAAAVTNVESPKNAKTQHIIWIVFSRELIVLKRVEKIKHLVSLLSHIDDALIESRLLKSCIGMPKFNFALRFRHPDDIKEAIVKFDEVMYIMGSKKLWEIML